jgi:hypothetical protein
LSNVNVNSPATADHEAAEPVAVARRRSTPPAVSEKVVFAASSGHAVANLSGSVDAASTLAGHFHAVTDTVPAAKTGTAATFTSIKRKTKTRRRRCVTEEIL